MKRWLALCCLLLLPLSLRAAPDADLWSYWSAHQPDSRTQVNHAPWQAFLSRYVVASGQHHLVRYDAVSAEDAQALADYLADMQAQDPLLLNRDEQMTYWINLYNATTVHLILANYPVDSITQLGGLFAFGPWDKPLLNINGKAVTLNDIEHRILRPIWQDKRIHYAVNCASMGCPNLLQDAFTASTLNAQLDAAATQFINAPKGITIGDDGRITLSKIYEWYAVDFGDKAALIAHLQRYHKQPIQKALESGRWRYRYDWDLNQAR